jgi:phage baseplate assembly protein W
MAMEVSQAGILEKLIGTGLNDPLQLNARGGLKTATGYEKLYQGIKRLLFTRLGERVMMPDYGTRLPELLFDPLDEILEDQLRLYTVDAIRKWEPRVDVLGFSIETVPDAHQITIYIRIKLKKSNLVNVFVYTINTVESYGSGTALYDRRF